MAGDVQTSRVTRNSVLGKRAHQQQDATTATPTKSGNVHLPTPDSTPNPKRPRTSISCYDGDSNKENVPPSSSQSAGSDLAPTIAGTTGSIRSSTSEQLTPTRSRQIRRHASTTSATPAIHSFSNSLLTTPPTTPKTLLPLHARVKALLRTTCNDANTTITCRAAECDVIMRFLRSFLSGEATQRGLYISGSPGTGKTALLNSVLRTSELDLCNVVSINCMALKSVDELWQQLFDNLVSTNVELKKVARLKKLKGRDAVEMALAALSKRCILVLDELDHIASDPRALGDILTLPKNNSKSFCLIGIANTHTLTSGMTSGTHSTTEDVVTIHFAPYTATQLQEILQSRLCLLNDSNDDAMKTFLPSSVLMLLTKKVAAMTGDVRKLFEVLRGAIDIAISSSNDENSPSHTIKVTPAYILQALKLYASTTSSTSKGSLNGSVACNNEIIAKINDLNLQARIILLCVLLASKRLGANLPLSSASTSPRKAPPLKRSSSANCSRQTGIDTAQLHNYYSAALLRCDAACLNVASRSEFSDLLVILEGAGLINSGSPIVSSTSSTRQGKKTLGRSVSFPGLRKTLATSEIRLAEGVWMVEVLRGLGIADDNDDNVLQSEIRGIWERETARMERETNNLGQCESPSLD